MEVFFLHLAGSEHVLDLRLGLDTMHGAAALFQLALGSGIEANLLRLQDFAALLDTPAETPEQALKAFAFFATDFNQKYHLPFLRILRQLYQLA